MSDIHRTREVDTGLTYMVMAVPVSEMLDAISCHPRECTACQGEAIVRVPADTPLQWSVLQSHEDGCPIGEQIYAGLHVVSSTHTQ